MRKNKRVIVTLEKTLTLWRVTLPDGRTAELAAKSKKQAAEQASAIWALPLPWLQEHARIREAR